MKKCIIVIFAAVFLLLMSCATVPEPQNSSDSLVVGRLILDFPDGYFSKPAKTIDSNVTVKILNIKTGAEYAKRTDNGYFYIPAEEGDVLLIKDYYYNNQSGRYSSSLNGGIGHKVKAEGNSIVYFGDLKITYTSGTVISKDGKNSSFHYDMRCDISYKPNEIKLYLKEKLAESSWNEKPLKSVRMYK